MATITFNKEYNYWDILVSINIQPREKDKYTYVVDGHDATLSVNSVSQKDLEQALEIYDHQKFLDNLPKSQLNDKERIKKLESENEELTTTLEFLLLELIPSIMVE